MSNPEEPQTSTHAIRTAPLNGHLAVAVTFFYDESRFGYLEQIAQHYPHLATQTSVWVVTNTRDEAAHKKIHQIFNGVELQIVVPSHLGHPLLLPWFHRDIFAELYRTRPEVSHFLYVEDDLEVTPENVRYWLEAREVLRPFSLIPSFLRVEEGPDGHLYSSDVYRSAHIGNLPRLIDSRGYWVNLRYPYQASYLMDRELMAEFLQSPTQSPDSGTWPIREKATQGLIYSNVPKGCFSRAFIRVGADGGIPGAARIHHLPNNYAMKKGNKYGGLRVGELVRTQGIRIPTPIQELSKLVSLRVPKRRRFMVHHLD